MSVFDRFRPPDRPSLRFSEEARRWASCHFPESHQQIAAVVAGIFCEQTGARFSDLSAASRFVEDLGLYDFFDTVDYSRAVQQEFHLSISDHDLTRIHRISELVDYLYERTR